MVGVSPNLVLFQLELTVQKIAFTLVVGMLAIFLAFQVRKERDVAAAAALCKENSHENGVYDFPCRGENFNKALSAFLRKNPTFVVTSMVQHNDGPNKVFSSITVVVTKKLVLTTGDSAVGKKKT